MRLKLHWSVVLLSCVLASCGSSGSSGHDTHCRPVVALVASSMIDAFGEFSGNPCAAEWKVTGGSSTALVAQVREGSPADAFVSAGKKAITQLQDEKLVVGEPVELGSVPATLYVARGNENSVTFEQLPQLVAGGWKVGACVASAPCGAMVDELLANATAVWGGGFTRRGLVVTEAESASALMTQVAMGEIDAALTYANVCNPPPNAEATGTCVDIPDSVSGKKVNVLTPFFAVRLREGTAADSFMRYVQSEAFRVFISERMGIK